MQSTDRIRTVPRGRLDNTPPLAPMVARDVEDTRKLPTAGSDMTAARPQSDIFFGWWIVGGAFVIYFVGGGLLNTGTVYFKALSTDLGLSRGALSGAFSLGFLIAGVSSPIWGRIADRRGARAAFLPGVLLTGVLCVLLSRVASLASLYVLYVLFAVSSAGISLVPVSVIISKWFTQKRGRAIGIAYMGEGLGSLALTPVAGVLVATVGWRHAYILSGFVLLVALTPVALWMKSPEDVGVVPDGLDWAPSRPGTTADDPVCKGFSLADGLRTPAFWMVALSWLVAMMPLAAVGLHQVPFMTDLGFSTERAALAAGGVGGMSVLGRLGLGLMSERLPIRPIYAACYLLMGVAIAALWITPRVGSSALILYVALFGIAVGGAFALSSLLVGDLFGVQALGEIFGLLGLAATIGGAIGGTGAGLLFDAAGSYDAVFALSVALSVLAAGLMLLVKAPRQ